MAIPASPADGSLRVVLLGASGMVGSAVLSECLADPAVEKVLSLGRGPSGRTHPKLTDLVHHDMFDLAAVAGGLAGYDACFFTVGTTSAGKSEGDYTRLTYDLTASVAKTLLTLNPGMSIVYVTGAGADSTEKGSVMWARVKGRTENHLLKMGFRSATMIRLAGLVPAPGFRSKTALYNLFYVPFGPVLPLLARAFPNLVTTPHILGRAFIRAAQGRSPKPILEPRDINALGSASGA